MEKLKRWRKAIKNGRFSGLKGISLELVKCIGDYLDKFVSSAIN